MFTLETRVISRIKSSRRPTIQEHLESKDVSFSFFDAADKFSITRNDLTFSYKWHNISVNTDNNYGDSFNGRKWVNIGEIGCLYSHYSLWKELVESEYDATLILEDDAKLLFTGEQLAEFTKTQNLDGIDLIFCQRNSPNFVTGKRAFEHLTNKIEILATTQASFWEICEGTAGYILTKAGAKKLITPIEKFGFLFPADNHILRCVQKPPIGVSIFGGMNAFLTTKELQIELSESAKTSEIHDKKQETVIMIGNMKFKD